MFGEALNQYEVRYFFKNDISHKAFRAKCEGEESIDDGVITPDGEVVKTHPMDYIMAVKNPFDMLGGLASGIGGMFGGGGGIDYDKLAAAISNQPLQIVIDGRVISEITRKQNQNKSFNKQAG